nr:MAG TPA: hypothetical protein [Caudoviricetes sp.]
MSVARRGTLSSVQREKAADESPTSLHTFEGETFFSLHSLMKFSLNFAICAPFIT